MKGELVVPIYARHQAAALAVDRPIHPGAPMGNDVVEPRTADVDGEHPSAYKVAYHAAFTNIANAEGLARRATSAIGAERIGGAKRRLFAAITALSVNLDTGPGVSHRDH